MILGVAREIYAEPGFNPGTPGNVAGRIAAGHLIGKARLTAGPRQPSRGRFSHRETMVSLRPSASTVLTMPWASFR